QPAKLHGLLLCPSAPTDLDGRTQENPKIATHRELLRMIEGHILRRNKMDAEAVLSAPPRGRELDEGRNALRQGGNHSVKPEAAKGRREAMNFGADDVASAPPRI